MLCKSDVAWAREGREEQPLAAEQDVLEARHHLDVEADRRLHDADMAGVDEETLARCETAVHHLAGQIEPDHARSAHALEDEALAAEEAGTEALGPGDSRGSPTFPRRGTSPCGQISD